MPQKSHPLYQPLAGTSFISYFFIFSFNESKDCGTALIIAEHECSVSSLRMWLQNAEYTLC